MFTRKSLRQFAFSLPLATAATLAPVTALHAQAPAGAIRQTGTVKSVSATSLTISTDANASYTVTPADGVKLLQLPAGSTDLKTATPIAITNIAAGDRVLVTGRPGDQPSTLLATRIILMKSSDIASLHAGQTADWQRRGTGGLVKVVSGDAITVTSGAKLLTISTTPATIFRRYAGDSVKFEDAKPGTLADIHTGDQLRVRGAKSDDGSTVTAEEVVSGSFENLAGAISRVDSAAGTITLKDLASRQTVTVQVTPNSDLRHLPAEAAAAFARAHAPAAPGPEAAAAPTAGQRAGAGSGAGPSTGPGSGSGRRAGMDLSQMLARLPAQPLAELKPGDAVLIVASKTGASVTAVTMLSGVEQILSASPGAAAPTLSPWNLGTGGAEGGEAGGGGAPGGGAR